MARKEKKLKKSQYLLCILLLFLLIERLALFVQFGPDYLSYSDDEAYVKAGLYFAETGIISMWGPYPSAMIMPAMPILIGLKIPYVIPILFGLFASPLGIIPCCSGVFTYYFLNGLKTNLTSFEQLNGADDPFNLYANIMGGLLKNEAMISAMIVFSLVIIAMFMVRNIRMDYSFEISVAVGTIVNLFVYIILMLQIEVGVSLSGLLFFSILSGVIVLLINSMYRPLYYAGTERVQFEDDDYYYFVMAVPKIKSSGSKVSEKLFITRRSSDDEFDKEDEDDDFLEDDK